MAFQSLSPCRSSTNVPTVAPSPATTAPSGPVLVLAVMELILPDPPGRRAATQGDDRHVENGMTRPDGAH
ncbi:hypothetical protein Pen02_03930 [Plantactinospora endophytica]|uniref:Uncharacterized protein n=1 Tax=Plantactinospora endophytica TaxID=673535 RepID=A0ABQ4DTM1_9ACTN|nr:hypothetical protein Pen02_03930 [Plantactinospora endophytica]